MVLGRPPLLLSFHTTINPLISRTKETYWLSFWSFPSVSPMPSHFNQYGFHLIIRFHTIHHNNPPSPSPIHACVVRVFIATLTRLISLTYNFRTTAPNLLPYFCPLISKLLILNLFICASRLSTLYRRYPYSTARRRICDICILQPPFTIRYR
jgi:hypothetical protein